ncbi:MAG: RNA 2',3'-cyclic phosphodiesterase [Gemmatimonadaceae bacterium]
MQGTRMLHSTSLLPKPSRATMRHFLAGTILEEIRDDVDRATIRARSLVPRIAWVASYLLHVTVKFLGEQSKRAATDIADAARKISMSVATIHAALNDAGAFPNFLAPRVVWIAMRHFPSPVTLASRLDAVLVLLGLEKVLRPSRPHVTLGRVKAPLSRDDAMRLEREMPAVKGSWPLRISHLSLLKSSLSHSAPRYSRVAERSLGGA